MGAIGERLKEMQENNNKIFKSAAEKIDEQNDEQNKIYPSALSNDLERKIKLAQSLILPSYNILPNDQQQVLSPSVLSSSSRTRTSSTTNQIGTQSAKSKYEYGSLVTPEEAQAAIELVKNAMNTGNKQDEYDKLIDRQRKADLVNAIGTAVYNLKKNLSGANVVGYVQPKEEKAPAYEAAMLKNKMDINQNMLPIYQTVLKSLLDKKLLERNYELQKAAQSSSSTISQTETEKFGLEGDVVGGRGGGSRGSDNNVVYTIYVNNKQFAAPLPKKIEPYIFVNSLRRLAEIDRNLSELLKKVGESGATLVDISKIQLDDILTNIVKSGDKRKIKLLAEAFYDMYQKYPNLYDEYDKKNIIDFYNYANELNKPVNANENNTAIMREKSAGNFVRQVQISK